MSLSQDSNPGTFIFSVGWQPRLCFLLYYVNLKCVCLSIHTKGLQNAKLIIFDSQILNLYIFEGIISETTRETKRASVAQCSEERMNENRSSRVRFPGAWGTYLRGIYTIQQILVKWCRTAWSCRMVQHKNRIGPIFCCVSDPTHGTICLIM
jgi:hypothetical protein